MSAIVVAGGVYHEHCTWPDWDQIYGSGGRAAAALTAQIEKISLRTYARPDTADLFRKYATLYGFEFLPEMVEQTISFDYVHCLSIPTVRPSPSLIHINAPFAVNGDAVLRFGMMEGSAVVNADWCVYDPQSAFDPRQFGENGSTAQHLAVVANRAEALALGCRADLADAASALLAGGAEVVVVKAGSEGAVVYSAAGRSIVPAFRTDRVWTIGSGDVFAAIFAREWAINRLSPADAANVASRAVAEYANTMALPIPPKEALASQTLPAATSTKRHVYLAGPFFTISQRWHVDDARRCLQELGMDVFSPVHDVGHGLAEEVAPADLRALESCDVVFAIVDGLDSGTMFEVGYARARGKPVYTLAQTVSDEDLKMLKGSGCIIFDDFVTALYHLAWQA